MADGHKLMMKRFDGRVAVVTGGARGIGKAIADAFGAEGALVHVIDICPGDWFVGDVGDRETLERFARYVIERSKHVDFLVNNALPLMKGIDECSWEDFSRALAVGVTIYSLATSGDAWKWRTSFGDNHGVFDHLSFNHPIPPYENGISFSSSSTGSFS